ncbi:unnamed protein product [Polarella glacialis]|uniref:Uncharacterized protein n=2 Tax=Polarella glacialis TaxID=89957 RepID=A0A813HFS5_POLGL|nr:unnamed protein product [Polarella glacialis]
MHGAAEKKQLHLHPAFAAVMSDGSVITWGHARRGGDSSRVEHRLQEGVVHVARSCKAFAVVKLDGSVITWKMLVLKETVLASRIDSKLLHFFAAVKLDGSVITWGDAVGGGDSSRVRHRLQEGVVQVVGIADAFADVQSDGSVITWGHAREVGDSSRVEHQLQEDVMQIVGNACAFAAVKSNGSVITWGDAVGGGDRSHVEHRLFLGARGAPGAFEATSEWLKRHGFPNAGQFVLVSQAIDKLAWLEDAASAAGPSRALLLVDDLSRGHHLAKPLPDEQTRQALQQRGIPFEVFDPETSSWPQLAKQLAL